MGGTASWAVKADKEGKQWWERGKRTNVEDCGLGPAT